MKKVHIFLAEDNSADVWLIQEALRRQSLLFHLDHYLTAQDAINAVRVYGSNDSPVPDLLLLDYNLPGGQGSDVLIAAAANPKLAAVPKAILSSFLRPDEMSEAANMGALCFIPKPANLTEFLRDVGAKVTELLLQSGAISGKTTNA